MTYRVLIRAEIAVAELNLKRLSRLARTVLAAEGAPSGEVGVVLTGDEGIQALNWQYLGHDDPTDVLSFGLGEEGPSGFVQAERGLPYLGDVAISVERAREQAVAYGHSWEREVELLLVHGLLHLLGYDDGAEEDRRRMEARQEALLAAWAGRHPLGGAFRAALVGLENLFRTQRNMRIHLVIAAAVLVLAAVLQVALWEWAALVLTIALVLASEALNAALEALVDLVSPERRPLAGRVKDLGAAAVLIAAILAVVIGGIVFLPHLLDRLR